MPKKKSKSEKELIAKMEFVEKYGLEIPKKTFFQRHPIIEGIFYYFFGSIFITSIIYFLVWLFS